jgi:hypothetical protein
MGRNRQAIKDSLICTMKKDNFDALLRKVPSLMGFGGLIPHLRRYRPIVQTEASTPNFLSIS